MLSHKPRALLVTVFLPRVCPKAVAEQHPEPSSTAPEPSSPLPIPPSHIRSQRAKKVRTPGNLTPWPTSHPAEERDRRKKAPAPPSQVPSSPGQPAIPVNTWYQRMNKTANRRGCHSSANLPKSRGSHHSGLLAVTHPPPAGTYSRPCSHLTCFSGSQRHPSCCRPAAQPCTCNCQSEDYV